jgi:hypothetical protein
MYSKKRKKLLAEVDDVVIKRKTMMPNQKNDNYVLIKCYVNNTYFKIFIKRV